MQETIRRAKVGSILGPQAEQYEEWIDDANVQHGAMVPSSGGMDVSGILSTTDFVQDSSAVDLDANGRYYVQRTGAVIDQSAYGVTTSVRTRRAYFPAMSTRFAIQKTTAYRLFIGVANTDNATMLTSDNPPYIYAGFMFSTVRGDTTIQAACNVDGASQLLDDIDGAAPPTSLDALRFILRLAADPSPLLVCEVRNAADEVIGSFATDTGLPPDATDLYFWGGVNTTDAAEQDIRRYGTRVCNRFSDQL